MTAYLIMEDGTEHPIGNEDVPIECFRCGICCMLYRPKVTRDEIEKIAQELSLSTDEFITTFVRTIPEKNIMIIQNNADYCPFLRLEKKTHRATCLIHHCRPRACINWQAGLSRPECMEGLNKLSPEGIVLLPKDMYSSPDEINTLYSAVSNNENQQ